MNFTGAYLTWCDPVPLVLLEALQGVNATLQPVGHHAQLHRAVPHICGGQRRNAINVPNFTFEHKTSWYTEMQELADDNEHTSSSQIDWVKNGECGRAI